MEDHLFGSSYNSTQLQRSDQFPYWISGLFLILLFLSLTPYYTWSEQVSPKKQSEITSSINAIPNLVGDENLCLVIGGVLGTYHAGGETGDVYDWTLTNSAGIVIDHKSNGQLETYKYNFTEEGTYKVSLKLRRGTNPDFYTADLTISVKKGPELALKPDYLLCGNDPVLLTAINPDTPNLSSYSFEWRNSNDPLTVLETGNVFEATYPGFYDVVVFSNTCEIKGTAYVGPPIDFKILTDSEQLCEGSSINLEIDTPLIGEWFIQKENDPTKSSLGQNYEIRVNSSDLTGPGIYQISFRADDKKNPNCPSERHANIELLSSPIITTADVVEPDDCASSNGSFNIFSGTDLDAITIVETGHTETNVIAGQSIFINGLNAGIYTIQATQNGCTSSKLVLLEAQDPPISTNPPVQIQVDTDTTGESCSSTGVVKGSVNIQFAANITDGKYRILTRSSGTIKEGTISNTDHISEDLSSGNYILELTLDGCTYPFEEFTVLNQPEVKFTIPTSFNICETYDLFPQSDENLLYTLTYLDGSGRTESGSNGDSFSLTEEGTYSIYGESSDPNSTSCGKTISFTTTFSSAITFAPEKIIGECFDPISYRPNIDGLNFDEVSIRWLNTKNEIVGRSAVFYPTNVETYGLLVQPLESGFCPSTPVWFEVEPPVTSVAMDLQTTKICPDPGTATITLTTDEEEVAFTEWVYYDLSNNREELHDFNDLFEISVDKIGAYEVVAYSIRRCEIGRELIDVVESTFTTLPNLEDSYAICSKENTLPSLDPGEFEEYQWFFEGDLVSENRLFKPDQVGDYTLVATTEDNCEFTAEFRTYDACNFQVVFPNAMILGDPARDFRVLVSEGVNSAELYIINRQGELIHHDSEVDVPLETPILQWDGKVNGAYIPQGTYVVVLVLRNPLYGFEEKMTGSLLVVE